MYFTRCHGRFESQILQPSPPPPHTHTLTPTPTKDSNTTKLGLDQIERIAGDKLNDANIIISMFDDIVGGENARYPYFILVQQFFKTIFSSKGCYNTGLCGRELK